MSLESILLLLVYCTQELEALVIKHTYVVFLHNTSNSIMMVKYVRQVSVHTYTDLNSIYFNGCEHFNTKFATKRWLNRYILIGNMHWYFKLSWLYMIIENVFIIIVLILRYFFNTFF